jgi:hypothetical protein
MKNILLSIVFVLIASSSHAATIWCNPANNGTQNGTTKATGYKTLWSAMAAMNAGDEVIIADGDWSGSSGMSIDNSGHLPPSGTSYASMSIIRAETDFGVRLPALWDGGTGRNYVRLQGIIFSGDGHSAYGWNYSEFLRCGFFTDKVTDNAANFSLQYGEYNLIEECIAWGGGRYKFLDYHGDRNIYRRCISRHDWYISTWPGQESNFRGYGSTNTIWQNCIAIDSNREQYQTTASQEDGDFWVGDQAGSGGNKIIGCIVIKGMYQAYYFGGTSGGSTTVTLENSVALGPSLDGTASLTGAVTFGEITMSSTKNLFYGYNVGSQHGISHNKASGSGTATYSILKNTGSVSGVSADYNNYYSVTGGGTGTNQVTTNPSTNGMLYPVRMETGSNLANAGIGPTILKKIGVSGTHHGQTGYETVTTDNLWPFPNEATIKTLMSTTVDGVSGIYGFTAGTSIDGSAQTLTKYIWEQFGNQIPADIYGGTAARMAIGAGAMSIGAGTMSISTQ